MTSWPLGTGAVPKLKPVAALFAQPLAFSRALAAEYDTLIGREERNYSSEFESAYFNKKLAMARANRATTPMEISRFGLEGAVAVALAEGRSRLTRAMGGRSLSVAPVLAARAQAAFDCWAERAGIRLPSRDVAICKSRFFRTLFDLEQVVLPIKAHSVFNQTLAREYLAYANFETRITGDTIDARHFARKGLNAAQTRQIDAILPETLGRWNLNPKSKKALFQAWRWRLMQVLAVHRTGPRASLAATAQARFDCWIERVSENADHAYISKCRSEFLGSMRELEYADRGGIALIRLKFRRRSARLDKPGLKTLREVAKAAIRSNALSISIISRSVGSGFSRGTNGRGITSSLGHRRIENLAKRLSEMGVRADRIRLLYIEDTPTKPTSDKTGKSGVWSNNAAGQIAEIVIQ